MNVTDRLKSLDFKGRDFPILKGDVKMTLKNVHNGKTEVFEKHNLVTNALSDIFGNNYGGLVNYNSFADLYKTYLGGVLVFASALDSDPTKYGIPAYTSNPVTAHAGQTPLTSQNDDTTRGNPDDSATSLTSNSTKLVWEWGTNAGNGSIASLGLTHSDVGSFGCGSRSDGTKPTCLQSLNPFVDVGCISKSYAYGDDGASVLAIDGNVAYTFYLVDSTTVDVFKTPINNSKFKLQGGSLAPLTDYSSKITVTIQNYNIADKGGCYYHFDFANQKLILFGVPTQGGERLLIDEIDLSNWTNQTSTQTYVDVSGAKLWKFTGQDNVTGFQNVALPIPTKAIIYNGYIFVYGNKGTGDYDKHPTKMFKVNLSNFADQNEIDTTLAEQFDGQSGSRTNERFTSLGGIIIHNSFLINGDKVFPVAKQNVAINAGHIFGNDGISAPCFGIGGSLNSVALTKLYLGTKWNLDSAVTKNASQSMTVEYTLTEV